MKYSLLSKIALIVLFFTFNQTIYAQDKYGRLMGSVININKEPIVGATIILSKAKDNALIKALLTDANGRFEFENVKFDTCKLSITFVGMGNYTSEFIVLNEQSPNVNLPPIVLSENANALATVEVTANKLFVVQKIDRVVVNPDALIGNAGTTSLEVLEKSPGVTVDINGNVSLKGKPGVVIFIDDKPTYLAAADLANYLRSIPSSSIETIEIMTNPPAKYDAEGNAGVINIKLKKNIAKGFNGGVNLAYGQGFYLRTNNSFNFKDLKAHV